MCILLCAGMEQARRRRQRLAQLRQELAQLEAEQTSVETRGVEIERQLRGKEVREGVKMAIGG